MVPNTSVGLKENHSARDKEAMVTGRPESRRQRTFHRAAEQPERKRAGDQEQQQRRCAQGHAPSVPAATTHSRLTEFAVGLGGRLLAGFGLRRDQKSTATPFSVQSP